MFVMDDLDESSFYYHDWRKENVVKKRWQMAIVVTMFQAGIGYKGKTDLWFVEGKINVQKTYKFNLRTDQ